MITAGAFLTAFVLLAFFNVYAILLVRAAKVSVPLGATVFLAATPFSIVVAASWVTLHYGHFVSSGHMLETVFKFKIGATGIAFVLFLVVDVPQFLERCKTPPAVVRGTHLLGRALLLFVLYTLSYGPWVYVGSRHAIPLGNLIHDGFYAPLHWISSHCSPYAYVVRELFWLGYGPV